MDLSAPALVTQPPVAAAPASAPQPSGQAVPAVVEAAKTIMPEVGKVFAKPVGQNAIPYPEGLREKVVTEVIALFGKLFVELPEKAKFMDLTKNIIKMFPAQAIPTVEPQIEAVFGKLYDLFSAFHSFKATIGSNSGIVDTLKSFGALFTSSQILKGTIAAAEASSPKLPETFAKAQVPEVAVAAKVAEEPKKDDAEKPGWFAKIMDVGAKLLGLGAATIPTTTAQPA